MQNLHTTTQSIKFPESEGVPALTSKMEVKSCLMTMEHRMPTLEEIDTLEVVTITGDSNWNPKDHNTHPGPML